MTGKRTIMDDNTYGTKGFHTLWTKPFFHNNTDTVYSMQDYELLTMLLSAIMWKKKNGDIALYGDSTALDYVDSKGIAGLWTGGLHEVKVSDDIAPNVFWAAGKLYALRQMQMPAVMVDLDLVVWQNVSGYVKGTDICAIHREGISPDVYPDKLFFNMKNGYTFDDEWSWDVPPVNTCMLYIKDEQFKNYYTDSAIQFMENCEETRDNLCHMVFAEQRLLAMCADKCGKVVSSFFPSSFDIERQDVFTHLWGYKNILKYNFEKRIEFCEKIKARIITESRESEEVIRKLRLD